MSTVGSPPIFFGRDPNDLTSARGRLPNDRPRVFRAMGSLDVPRTGLTLAANFQHFSGKPWAETALVSLPQNPNQRVLLEPRGSRRLSSQSLLDVRLSKPMRVGGIGRIDVLVDVLNALNDAAEESLAGRQLAASDGSGCDPARPFEVQVAHPPSRSSACVICYSRVPV